MTHGLSHQTFPPAETSRELVSKLRQGSDGIRAAFLEVLLGAAPIGGKARKVFFDGSKLRIDGLRWSISEPKKGSLCLVCQSGRDLLSLAHALFGGRKGVAAVRILEAVSGVKFDPRAASAIADQVDEFFVRKDGK